jgi:hypothetical protein
MTPYIRSQEGAMFYDWSIYLAGAVGIGSAAVALLMLWFA